MTEDNTCNKVKSSGSLGSWEEDDPLLKTEPFEKYPWNWVLKVDGRIESDREEVSDLPNFP